MDASQFAKLVTRHGKFRMFLISRLPMVWLSGIHVANFTDDLAQVTLPYKYLTKNPFRSIYFACQAMAAELSTGLFGFRYAQLEKPSVSMLVVSMEAKYHKKAVGLITFSCSEGLAIKAIIEKARDTGEGQIIKVKSTGTDQAGDVVAEFWFEWSFKVKS